MRVGNRLRKLVGSPLRWRVTRQAAQFLLSTADCREIQRATLQRLIKLNADSRFGHDYGLHDVRSVADLRKRLPITNYEFYTAHIDALKAGDESALLGPKNRLLMFCLTSGPTSASKYIPVTTAFLEDYRRGWRLWGIQALNDHPDTHLRTIVQLNSDHNRYQTAGGTPCGNISGLTAIAQPRIIRSMYSVPHQVAKIKDSQAKYYAALRFALADDNVGFIMTANPSTLIRLATFADSAKEDLIRDIANGALSNRYEISSDIRQQLGRQAARARPGRARQLEEIVERTGRLYPRDYWFPNLLIGVWTSGSCAAYLEMLRRYYGDAPVRDHGLSASEGRMTIPIRDGHPDGILEINTHFFEFIPEAEYGTERPAVLEAHELQEGQSYYILLTTSSGFYRYDICDVVQCVGFHRATPMLRFLHKGSHISSITGEKLSESQAVEAVTGALESVAVQLDCFSVVPVWGEPPGYRLLIEAHAVPSRSVLERLAGAVESRLQELNCEYREKRLSGRLNPVTITELRTGAWKELFERRTASLGGSVEQYKHPCLIPDLKTASELLESLAVRP